jgi:uncharacterized protein YdiU (UPF0061 family)
VALSSLAQKTQPFDLGAGRVDHSYGRLPPRFYARVKPTPVRSPQIVQWNDAVAYELGLDASSLSRTDWGEVLSGSCIPHWAEPLAMAYAGHQFGVFVPQLGDGRAILLGEIIGRDGKRRDLQLKGSGRTPFSRDGDGRAALGPALREYIISEAIYALGIPTTRSLAVVMTGEAVIREATLPGAVLVRVADSHLRVGTFEYFAARGDQEAIRLLADYAIERHYPELRPRSSRYLEFLAAVCDKQAALVARWLEVGFIHGVMNTDNMTISGETIDYGPCAFMDAYDPATVFSSIDHHGRYAFGNQPRIALWNLARLAESMLPLIHEDQKQAVPLAEEALNRFPDTFMRYWQKGMRRKLGIVTEQAQDTGLIDALLEWMKNQRADYTNTFCRLSSMAEGAAAPEGLTEWVTRWQTRLAQEPHSAKEAAAIMRQTNPAVIPRNHQVEAALSAAVNDQDFRPTEALLTVLATPYQLKPEYAGYAAPAPPSERPYKTFCGT